jgi:hypothetical protein
MAKPRPCPYIGGSTDGNRQLPVNKQTWLISAFLVLLCGGIFVAFTDVEIRFVRWVSCGPLSTQQEDRTELCR